ncbi:ABC transporter permease, partial [Ochrobactrum sp. GRS2]|nr:ABC transporter permease [Ochrobactrum sp. GRS2]
MADASISPEPFAAPKRGSSIMRRLLQRKLAVVGLLIILICVGGAVFAQWLAPFDPNEQFFEGLTIEGAPMPP